ncbi:restriction endonuclease subunit S [Roseburia faecis]|uniref:restriction endonuclease subunit S n=1 Tax=Roseburia faecis TaxID=301302 RepID=UPI003F9D89E0
MGKPKIRFKGYEDDWEQRKLSEIAIEKLSNGIMNNQANDETGLRHINVINMYDPDKIHPEKLTFSNYDEDAVKKCNVEWGDIFLTRSSLKPEGIAESNVLLDSGRFVYDDHLIRLKLDKEKYDPFFVKLNLSGSIFKRQFIARAKTTAFTTIGQEDIAECFGLFPEKEEQEKIGTYFSNLDHLITLHQRKCEETKSLKKYMLQKMFPENGKCVPEIRFSGFSDDWEQRKVQDIYKITRGYVLAAPETNENPSDDMPYPVYSSQTKNNGLMGYYKDYLYEDAITWTTDGANAGTVNYRAGKFYCTNVCGVLLSEEGYANKCAAEALNNVAWRWVSHVGNPKLMNNVMGEIPISLPVSIEEQNQISRFLEEIDNLITLHQHKCDELQKLKKFMLQNMFV